MIREETRTEQPPIVREVTNFKHTPNVIQDMRPNSKRVTVWVEELVDKPKNSLLGLSCSVDILGVQFEKFKKEAVKFSNFPVIDRVFMFLLGTTTLSFYCETIEGIRYKVLTTCEAIPIDEWLNN